MHYLDLQPKFFSLLKFQMKIFNKCQDSNLYESVLAVNKKMYWT